MATVGARRRRTGIAASKWSVYSVSMMGRAAKKSPSRWSSTGVLTLSGIASLAAYQAALDSVTFSSTSLNPTSYGADPARAGGSLLPADRA